MDARMKTKHIGSGDEDHPEDEIAKRNVERRRRERAERDSWDGAGFDYATPVDVALRHNGTSRFVTRL